MALLVDKIGGDDNEECERECFIELIILPMSEVIQRNIHKEVVRVGMGREIDVAVIGQWDGCTKR